MTKFRFLTSGESHGKCLNAIIEGVPAGFAINKDFINTELARRQVGYGRGGRMAIEKDTVEILSGVRFGISTGAPVSMEIQNKDWENWEISMSTDPVDLNDGYVQNIIKSREITRIRPGHADFAGAIKYGHLDIRNVLERSSARETATRVAVGAIAKCILSAFSINGFSHVTRIGKITADNKDLMFQTLKIKAENSDLRCADDVAYEKMKAEIDTAKENGDTLGGDFEIVFENIPVGLGSFVHWDKKLDGLIAQAVMSIPAVKSVEIGRGKEAGELFGSEMHDEVFYENWKYVRRTNNAGGLEGGMTNGENIIVKGTMKAIPTMKKPLDSIDIISNESYKAHFERSDVCAVPACAVVAEAMVAIVLADAFLEKFGGDSYGEIRCNFDNYRNYMKKR